MSLHVVSVYGMDHRVLLFNNILQTNLILRILFVDSDGAVVIPSWTTPFLKPLIDSLRFILRVLLPFVLGKP